MAAQSSDTSTTAPCFVFSANLSSYFTAGDGDAAANVHSQDSYNDRRH